MNQLSLEPICNSQEHIFRKNAGRNHCERCYKEYTDYKCKNCYRELCRQCEPLYIEPVFSKTLPKPPQNAKQDELREQIRTQDIQMNNECYQKKSHRVIGRKIEDNSPPRGLRSVFGFFK
tara:strand:+ start:615 stop:974 length:360 start_codon:yes stop_codon:yes gene_type:complete